MKKHKYFILLSLIVLASLFLRFFVFRYVDSGNQALAVLSILVAFGLGTTVVFLIAEIIEETTAVLRGRTGLAGGLIQAVGTALPDMIVGITAALMSIQAMSTDYALAINYAIIAASSTFGSNIYNMGFAAWCIYRQNLSNRTHRIKRIFPFVAKSEIRPMDDHKCKPNLKEVNTSIRVIASLSVLTALIALMMVFFGKSPAPAGFSGDLYGLKPYIGLTVLVFAVSILFLFRKNYSDNESIEDNYFEKSRTITIWFFLVVCAVSIFLTAETMVEAVNHASALLHLPVVIGGTLAGIIGCLAEMIVVYRFTINPSGRIGDAVVGVAMDNIITIIGASVVAVIGGIFLGGNSLIVIFIMILTVNMLLVWQVSELKDFYTEFEHFKN